MSDYVISMYIVLLHLLYLYHSTFYKFHELITDCSVLQMPEWNIDKSRYAYNNTQLYHMGISLQSGESLR